MITMWLRLKMAPLLLVSGFAAAQGLSLEEIQRRIDEAKKAKSKPPAAATAKASAAAKIPSPAKPKAAAPVEEPELPPPPPVEESKNLVKPIALRISTDADCELKLNGQLLGKLVDIQPREWPVMPGKHQFECASAEFPGVNDTRMKTVADGEGRTVHFSLIWRVSEERRAQLSKAQ